MSDVSRNGTDVAEPGPKLTCETCRHWHKNEPARVAGGAIDMSVPVRGVCRHSPPTATSLGAMTQKGIVSAGTIVDYPEVPPDWPACGQHEERKVSLVG